MKKNTVRKYFLADFYVLNCVEDGLLDFACIVEKLKYLGKFIVCEDKNGGYIEKLTDKKFGSIDFDLVEYGGLSDGIDFSNIYVDDNSKIKLSSTELKEYIEKSYLSDDNNVIEAFFERNSILNGGFPFRKTYYDVRVVSLLPGFDKAFEASLDYEKYVVNHGNYIVRKAEYGCYVELLSGKKFGCYGSDIASKHQNLHYYVFRAFSPSEPTLFVDKEKACLIPVNRLYGRVNEYCKMNTSKDLTEFFNSVSEADSWIPTKENLALKPSTKKSEKE